MRRFDDGSVPVSGIDAVAEGKHDNATYTWAYITLFLFPTAQTALRGLGQPRKAFAGFDTWR